MSTPTHDWGTNSHRQQATRAGLILVDGTGRPVHYDPEAIAVLTYPQHIKSSARIEDLLQREVQALLRGLGASHPTPDTAEFTSGRRRYLCRTFALTGRSGNGSRLMTGLLIERHAPKMVNVSEAAEQFHLTQREQETISLLTLGLTSKEIATRMKISPNTVKTFFRLVMTKMGVNTRSGIVGMIARL
jgi:DNA-binding CsgD family transcriptional regulator